MPEMFLDENTSGSAWAAEASGNVRFAFHDRDKRREVRFTRCLRRVLAAALLAAGLERYPNALNRRASRGPGGLCRHLEIVACEHDTA